MQKLQGWAQDGDTLVILGGLLGATKVQGSYPGATVTIYTDLDAVAISAIVRSANVVTVTVPLNSGFIAGENVTIAGVTDASFDGTHVIISVGATTFTYAQVDVDASSSGGTADSSLRLASIYADDGATPKDNPFITSDEGQWFFYATNGRYDVKFSGTGIAAPFTLGDFLLFDPQDDGNDPYTVTNVTPDRSYNANVTSIDELADVLGTLIADLKLKKIIL